MLLGIFLRRLATLVRGHTPLGPRWALVLVVVALTGALGGAFALQGPAIATEVRTLREELPRAAGELQARLERYDWGERAVESMPDPTELLPDGPDTVTRVTGVVSSTLSALASFAVILFLGLVLAATPGVYVRGLLALLPAGRVARGREVLHRLYDTLWWWLVGRVVAMTFIGVVTGVGLWLLGVTLATPLTAAAMVLLTMLHVQDVLGRRDLRLPSHCGGGTAPPAHSSRGPARRHGLRARERSTSWA